MNDEIKLKELEIELEKLKAEKEAFRHKYIMEQLVIKKEIATIYRSKKHLNKLKKNEKKEQEYRGF